MALNSSPLPYRHSTYIPATPSDKKASSALDVDEPSIAVDTVPCSPSPFTEPTQLLDRTQPTQIVHRTTLAQAPTVPLSSSPTSSVVEVLASSPFRSTQQAQKPSRRVTKLAPAGSYFRPPIPAPRPITMKRTAEQEPIVLSDDEDELSPTRGDIQRTLFQEKISCFAHVEKPSPALTKIQGAFGNTFTLKEYRSALAKTGDNYGHAISDLSASHAAVGERSKTSAQSPARSAILKPNSKSQNSIMPSSHILDKPPAKRRRLVQGLPPRSSPVSSQDLVKPPEPRVERQTEVIDLTDGDYASPSTPSKTNDDLYEAVLNCINTSTVDDLSAMTGIDKTEVQNLLQRRPFASLEKVKHTSTAAKKPGSGKTQRRGIGETVVAAVTEFTLAAKAIDVIVSVCEQRAKVLQKEISQWDLDPTGKSCGQLETQDDHLLTPDSSIEGTKGLKSPISSEPRLMKGHCDMRPFQIFGLNWLSLLNRKQYGCILADEMGLGKTCQVIALICHLVETYDQESERSQPWPNLIVVPPSTYANWLAEFRRFAPGLRVVGYQGSQAERDRIAAEDLDGSEDVHVVLSTYTQLSREEDIAAMNDLQPNAAIFDEGHKMKNPATNVYRNLIKIDAAWRLLLTGTPVQNNLMEMTALLKFVEPDMFLEHEEQIAYIFSHKVTIRDVSNGAFLYSERVSRARNILEPFILQRSKQQVLSDMPVKTHRVVHCDLSATQKPIYEEFERRFKSDIKTRRSGRRNDENNVWMQLRKAAIHPQLFRRYFDDQIVEEMASILMKKVPQSELRQPDLHYLTEELKNCSDFELHLWCRDHSCIAKYDVPAGSWMDSGKVQKCLELCKTYRENGDRVLIFSKFAKVIELLAEVLLTEDINHSVLLGMTDVSQRQQLIDEFNRDERISAFLLTTGAGGTGINLTSANKVIIFDQSDNPQDDIQAENRAHRLGQTRDVEVIRLITSNTVEELIYEACGKKLELAMKVTASVEENEKDVEKALEKEVQGMLAKRLTPP